MGRMSKGVFCEKETCLYWIKTISYYNLYAPPLLASLIVWGYVSISFCFVRDRESETYQFDTCVRMNILSILFLRASNILMTMMSSRDDALYKCPHHLAMKEWDVPLAIRLSRFDTSWQWDMRPKVASFSVESIIALLQTRCIMKGKNNERKCYYPMIYMPKYRSESLNCSYIHLPSLLSTVRSWPHYRQIHVIRNLQGRSVGIRSTWINSCNYIYSWGELER